MKIREAVESGITKIRQPHWAKGATSGEYLEVYVTELGISLWGTLHSILETADVPEDVRIAPRDVFLGDVPVDGWLPYESAAPSPRADGEGAVSEEEGSR